ncbi:histidine kinase [Dyadobacter sp. CY327]|uniref:sensor histidine kinase n=1 Tax=Dyadobacter sp. CY327 TaxID=2907301 RepID=UPI001F4196E7|nr:sensor histidine kinase [Dyadobacter sp. CY327]MCE7072568.1 histidine kinase [Dyadobacter sp. CY327]
MKMPKYIANEYQLMLGILAPYSVLLNFFIFSNTYFTHLPLFFGATCLTLSIKVVAWQLHTLVAMVLSKHFPKDGETMKRIFISLLCFFPLTALVNTFIFWVYGQLDLAVSEIGSANYIWALVSGLGLNLLSTFLHEGVSNFEKWKATLTETQQLKTAYAKSRLDGLKTQVNPHFLFNSINTLSSLITEDPEKAETFLDEMCKVYRYLLKGDKEAFVPLRTEIQFIRSWFYILKVRYGSAIRFDIQVTSDAMEKRIPPLTVQLLVEHILGRNKISKHKPLHISVISAGTESLQIHNTVALKIDYQQVQGETSLDNVINKFRLLDLEPVNIINSAEFQIIEIPLS